MAAIVREYLVIPEEEYKNKEAFTVPLCVGFRMIKMKGCEFSHEGNVYYPLEDNKSRFRVWCDRFKDWFINL